MSQYYSYLHCISARTGHMSKPHRGSSASMGLVPRRGFRWCKGHFASAGTGRPVLSLGAHCQHRRFHTIQCPHWALFFCPLPTRGEICPMSVLGLFLSQCQHWVGAVTGANIHNTGTRQTSHQYVHVIFILDASTKHNPYKGMSMNCYVYNNGTTQSWIQPSPQCILLCFDGKFMYMKKVCP